ncbi:MAG: glycosyltransferase family 2 protein [Paludibacteraceae bacterium]|nr:glycosyltransferase family 2 protein [Paludibacteraceae bacterium]
MQLSVVIVNYKVPYYLLQCLDSVTKAIKTLQAEIIVVDNASNDNSQALVARHFPHVIFVQNTENVGFATANNQAIAMAKGAFVLLLNPDTILPEDALVTMLHFATHVPQFGALGVRMINGKGVFLPESKRGVPTIANSLAKMLHCPALSKDSYYFTALQEHQSGAVPVLAGACMLLHKAVLGNTTYLDQRYFMYGEDIDLSYAITRAGYKNYYLPLTMLHYKGESTTYNAKYMRHFYGAMQLFYEKYYGKGLVNNALKLLTNLMVGIGHVKSMLSGKSALKESLADKAVTTLSTQQYTYAQIIAYIEQHGAEERIQIVHPDMDFTL